MSHERVVTRAVFLFAMIAGASTAMRADDWPQILGPSRNGISAEKNLLDAWPKGGPEELWRVPGGVGMSGLAISGGRVVTMVDSDGQQRVVALDAKSGKTLWATPVAKAFKNDMGNGPRATPTIAGERIFAFTGDGTLVALERSDGKVVWTHDVIKDTAGKAAEYGMASSPLISGSLVLVTAGSKSGTVVAYERESGKLAWKAGSDRAGYSSAAELVVGGRRQIVAFTGQSALGISPTGNVLWRYPYVTDFDCNIATPLAFDGKVFLSSGESHGCVLLELAPKGDEFQPKEAWKSFGKNSVMRNEWQTSMLIDGHLYGMDNVGSAGPVTHLNCVDIKSGKRLWQKTRFGKGNLIAADGKLFIVTRKGELVIVRASTKAYDEIGRKKVLAGTRQAPALSNGLLYLRDHRDIVCLDVRAK
jgi:outer membrane protein assembly factor BamB